MDETQTGLITLEKKLKNGKRQLTVGDAASLSAINMDDAKHALEALVEKYDSRLKVTENGDLIYDFGKSLRRRGKKSWKEIWSEVKDKAWTVFKFLFRIWITVMLVVYFVLFLVLMIGLVVISISRNSDDDGGFEGGGGGMNFFQMYLIMDLFTDLFMYRTVTRRTVYRTDPNGYRYKEYEPLGRKDKSGKTKKSFVASVYDFVFGPPRVEPDALENYREVAAYLREQKAIMVQSEVIGLAGHKKEEAEDFFTDCLVKFNGKAEVTDKGTLYGDFEDLVRGKAELDDTQVQWYWDEYEAPYRQTANSQMRNVIVGGMNGVNLFFSFKVMQGWLFDLLPGLPADTLATATIFLGIVPFVFSLIFFLIPTVRYFRNRKKNKEIHKHNIRKRLMKAIFNARDGQLPEETLMALVNQSEKEEKLDRNQIKEIMEDLVYDLGGELTVGDSGELVYHFEDLRREMEEVKRLRAGKTSDGGLGEVVFDSGGE